MANNLQVNLLQNNPVVQPTEVVVQVIFPTSAQAIAYTAGGDFVLIAGGSQLDPSNLGTAGPFMDLPISVGADELNAAGSYAQWVPGTTLANGKLQLFDANGTEFSGNYGTPWVTGAVNLRILLNSSDR